MDKRVLEAMDGVRSAAQVALAAKCEAHLQRATSSLAQHLYRTGVSEAVPLAERFAEAQREMVSATFSIIKAVGE